MGREAEGGKGRTRERGGRKIKERGWRDRNVERMREN